MLHSSVCCCFWRTIAVIIVAIISQDEVVSAHKLSHLTSTFIPSSSTPSLLRHRHQGSCKNNSCSGSFSGRIKHVDTATHVLCSSSSPISSTSQLTSPSPWSPGKWKLTLDFGVDEPKPDSSSLEQNENRMQLHKLLGDNWGAEGGRLVLPFEVYISSETSSTNNNRRGQANPSVEMTWLGGKPTGSIQCIPKETNDDESDEQIHHATYINNKGEQRVQISPGLWRNEPPTPILPSFTKILSGQSSSLRMYLKLVNSIERNTISFPEDQLLLLKSNTFRTTQYASGIQTVLPYQYAKEQSQQVLEEQLNHETGDRRLDGSDLLETAAAYKDIAALVMERDERRRRWKEVEGVLPKISGPSIKIGRAATTEELLNDVKRWGIWPGDTELMTLERGVVLAAVSAKQKKQSIFPWMQDTNSEEMVVVGKWSATPLFDE
mmetsp:Transcript_35185/g.71875  ORF Transcript_35185/g.71875 Transcript_35185/m.71875 type:complete len:435 (+) Transcript_35185:68-1372(+)